ncbi:glycosyltransferase family 4 protein [Patescibacteria group bacterium]|nr:glycosyltransferase family 4 protein [Candidatus Falkowbacteria bacterium]MBU3905841.1 glycosyltransferase family 4 protein [Patescibacteria group bacterium]MBU4027212.1 glycosyltransferase family 4 protein [Patescibacteria group bacterium]MBU4073391.1 glycosyltransferase family 4 protein [Patescibacteria group bacterium]MBU4102966.1 glycosyltransferase family 4 protein [Patescibacteria group bacterium]
MKTLLFTLEYPPFRGGVANYYGNIVKYWPSLAKTSGGKLEPNNIFVLHNNDNKLIKNWLYPKWLTAVWQVWKIIKKEKIDHILVGHIFPLGTVAYFISQITKTPYSVILHGMDFTFALRARRKRNITKRILKNAENIICGNSYTAGLVKKFIGDEYAGKIKVVNPGIESRITPQMLCKTGQAHNAQRITQIKEKYNLDNKLVLLTVGRLVKRKGVDKVLESLPPVLKKKPNLIYVILGNGPEIGNLKLEIGNWKLEKNVILITDADDESRNAWYKICDIFIMPARNIKGDFEGFGIVYLEANLAGKPVIAGNSGGARDAVENGVNGLLVNPEDINEISNAIIKLAQDENLRKKLGEQGRERSIREFSWEKQAEKIYNCVTYK